MIQASITRRQAKTPLQRWAERWGGPVIVVTMILVGTLLAALILGELRPCGLLDVVLRGNGDVCAAVEHGDEVDRAAHPAASDLESRDDALCQPQE